MQQRVLVYNDLHDYPNLVPELAKDKTYELVDGAFRYEVNEKLKNDSKNRKLQQRATELSRRVERSKLKKKTQKLSRKANRS